MTNYTLTLNNGHVVYMSVADGFEVEGEIAKYEKSLPNPEILSEEEINYYKTIFGDPLPNKVISYI